MNCGLDNRKWATLQGCWCVGSMLALPAPTPILAWALPLNHTNGACSAIPPLTVLYMDCTPCALSDGSLRINCQMAVSFSVRGYFDGVLTETRHCIH